MSLNRWGDALTLPNRAAENQDAVRLMGRDELNIAEFPIALLSSKTADRVKTLRCTREILLPSGQHLDQEWILTGSDSFGLPLPADQDVLLALIKLATDRVPPSARITFSRYEVMQLLGWPDNGKSFKRIAEAVRRYWSTRIFTRNSFWNRERREWTSHNGLSIIDAYGIVDRPSRGATAENLSWVRFGEEFFASLAAGYVKPLDLWLYRSLHLDLSKRLYRYLDKHRYRRASHSIALRTLASAHIGFSESIRERPATIKRALERGHQELIERGFLADVTYARGKDGEWRVTYAFAAGHPPEQPVLAEPEDPSAKRVDVLIRRGISPKNARELVATKSWEFIQEKLDAFDYLLRLGSSKPIRNPAGFLTQAIRDDWKIAPPGFQPRREREERDRARAVETSRRQEADLEEHRRLETARHAREALSPEELAALRAEAVAEVHRQFGGAFKFRENSPVVEAFLNGLIRERHMQQTPAP